MTQLTDNAQLLYTGELLLINRSNPLKAGPEYFIHSLAPALPDFPDILLQPAAAEMLSSLIATLGAEEAIIPVSGYRSMSEQTQIYRDSLRDNGVDYTSKYVALPGCSEHQTGLAIDLAANQSSIDFITPAFPYTGICQQFRLAAPRYGFIERYPAGAEAITGIAHEPWHFRYVGRPHAELITKNKLTLEEYISYVGQFHYGDRHLTYIGPSGSAEIYCVEQLSLLPPDWRETGRYTVSGDNAGRLIVTEWSVVS